MNYKPVSVESLKRYSLETRASKVSVAELGRPHAAGRSFADFVAGLPGFLAASDLQSVAQAIAVARKNAVRLCSAWARTQSRSGSLPS